MTLTVNPLFFFTITVEGVSVKKRYLRIVDIIKGRLTSMYAHSTSSPNPAVVGIRSESDHPQIG